MNFTIYTRSYHSDLFTMMCEFIPDGVEVERLTGYNDWQDADRFLRDVIKECNHYAVILDEDCFLYRFDAIPQMIAHMAAHGYTHAGMPDRGVSPHRTLQWTTLNPFFNIIDCPAIRMRGGLDKIDKPDFLACNTFEIFDDLYLQMWKVGKPLYLNAATTSDNLTTHLRDHNNQYFALHTWMSREWKNGHRERILSVYNTAKEWRK
jgi:hypothetical protein